MSRIERLIYCLLLFFSLSVGFAAEFELGRGTDVERDIFPALRAGINIGPGLDREFNGSSLINEWNPDPRFPVRFLTIHGRVLRQRGNALSVRFNADELLLNTGNSFWRGGKIYLSGHSGEEIAYEVVRTEPPDTEGVWTLFIDGVLPERWSGCGFRLEKVLSSALSEQSGGLLSERFIHPTKWTSCVPVRGVLWGYAPDFFFQLLHTPAQDGGLVQTLHARLNNMNGSRLRLTLRAPDSLAPVLLRASAGTAVFPLRIDSQWRTFEFFVPPEAWLSGEVPDLKLLTSDLTRIELREWVLSAPEIRSGELMPEWHAALEKLSPATLRTDEYSAVRSLRELLTSGALAAVRESLRDKPSGAVRAPLSAYLNWCAELHADPYLVLPPEQLASDYLALAEYLGAPPDRGLGRLRARHGRIQPWTAGFDRIIFETATSDYRAAAQFLTTNPYLKSTGILLPPEAVTTRYAVFDPAAPDAATRLLVETANDLPQFYGLLAAPYRDWLARDPLLNGDPRQVAVYRDMDRRLAGGNGPGNLRRCFDANAFYRQLHDFLRRLFWHALTMSPEGMTLIAEGFGGGSVSPQFLSALPRAFLYDDGGKLMTLVRRDVVGAELLKTLIRTSSGDRLLDAALERRQGIPWDRTREFADKILLRAARDLDSDRRTGLNTLFLRHSGAMGADSIRELARLAKQTSAFPAERLLRLSGEAQMMSAPDSGLFRIFAADRKIFICNDFERQCLADPLLVLLRERLPGLLQYGAAVLRAYRQTAEPDSLEVLLDRQTLLLEQFFDSSRDDEYEQYVRKFGVLLAGKSLLYRIYSDNSSGNAAEAVRRALSGRNLVPGLAAVSEFAPAYERYQPMTARLARRRARSAKAAMLSFQNAYTAMQSGFCAVCMYKLGDAEYGYASHERDAASGLLQELPLTRLLEVYQEYAHGERLTMRGSGVRRVNVKRTRPGPDGVLRMDLVDALSAAQYRDWHEDKVIMLNRSASPDTVVLRNLPRGAALELLSLRAGPDGIWRMHARRMDSDAAGSVKIRIPGETILFLRWKNVFFQSILPYISMNSQELTK